MINDQPLTAKQQKVVEEFEKARTGLGAVAESNIRERLALIQQRIEIQKQLEKKLCCNSF